MSVRKGDRGEGNCKCLTKLESLKVLARSPQKRETPSKEHPLALCLATDTGAIIRKMGKKKQGKQRRKLKKIYAKEQSGDYAPGTAHESLVSWLANAARGDTYHVRRKMIKFYKELEGSCREQQFLQTPRTS